MRMAKRMPESGAIAVLRANSLRGRELVQYDAGA
jgi:hypothetical protein